MTFPGIDQELVYMNILLGTEETGNKNNYTMLFKKKSPKNGVKPLYQHIQR